MSLTLQFDLRDKASKAFKKSADKISKGTRKFADNQQRQLAKARASWRAWIQTTEGAAAKMRVTQMATVAMTGVVAGLGYALVRGISDVAAYGDTLHKMSQRVGIGVEALSELDFAAELSGATLNDVEAAAKGLQMRLTEVAKGSKEGERNFTDYGIAVRDLNGNMLSTETVLLMVADKMAAAANETERNIIATRTLSRAGTRLIPMLAGGSQGLEELRRQARETGKVMTEEAAQSAADYTDAMSTLGASIAGIKQELALAILPELESAAEGANNLLRNMREGDEAARRMGENAASVRAIFWDLVSASNSPFFKRPVEAWAEAEKIVAATKANIILAGEAQAAAAEETKRLAEEAAKSAEAERLLDERAKEAASTIRAMVDPAMEFRNVEIETLNILIAQLEVARTLTDEERARIEGLRQGVVVGNAMLDAEEAMARAIASSIPAFAGLIKGADSLEDTLRNVARVILPAMVAQLIKMAMIKKGMEASSPWMALAGGVGALVGGLFHGGGVAGQATKGKAVDPGAVASAPRYHSGLAPNEVVAVLERGEPVLSNAQSAAAQRAGILSIDSRGRPQLNAGGGGSGASISLNIDTMIGEQEFVDRTVIPALEAVLDRQGYAYTTRGGV